jgi:TetR/AcrR family transcriptional repressor of mexJK operon
MTKYNRKARPRDAKKNKAILKSAMQLFLKNGYANTSMDAIAAHAKVTKQTVYSHYKSKDVLFSYMIAMLCEKYHDAKPLSQDSEQPVEALLYQIGILLLNMLTSKDVVAATRLVIAEAHHHPKLAERYYQDGTQRLITMLAQFLAAKNKRGKLHISDTASAASYFFALLKGRYYLRMLLGIKPIPPESAKRAHVRETVTIFMHLYSGNHPMHTKSVF